jgi:hypothetical protein
MKTSIRKRLFEDNSNDLDLSDFLNDETKEIEKAFFKKYKVIGLFEVYSKINMEGNNFSYYSEEYQKNR